MSRLSEYLNASFHDDPRPHAHVAGRIEYRDGGGGAAPSGSSGGFGSYSSSASAGAPTVKLSDAFPVVQGADKKWYIINQSGGVVGGPYETQSQASAARDAGRNVGNRFVPGELPAQLTTTSPTGSISPPSFEGGVPGGMFYQGAGTWEGGTTQEQLLKSVKEGVTSPERAVNTMLVRGWAQSAQGALDRLITEGIVTPNSTLQGISVLGQTTAQQAPAQTVSNTQAQGWWTMPISQGFGPTSEQLDSGYAGYANFNKGIDFAMPEGTPITANISGTVVAAGDQGDGWGISVKVRDAEGNVHNYGHLSAANVQPGQQINVGDLLGASGNTGKSTGPHLSYDVMNAQGEFFEPSQFLQGVQAPQQAYTGANADFYNTFGPAALAFAERYGVDPAFLLGMAASETNWGAASGYNVGGIMGTGTAGSKQFVSQGSDAPGSVGTFAQYNSPEEGYQAFFDLITQGRYANAWQAFQQHGDTAQLFRDLQQAGYTPATDWPDLVTSLAQEARTALGAGAGAPGTGLQQPGATPGGTGLIQPPPPPDPAQVLARARAAYEAAGFQVFTNPQDGTLRVQDGQSGRVFNVGVDKSGQVVESTPMLDTRLARGGFVTNPTRSQAIEQSAMFTSPGMESPAMAALTAMRGPSLNTPMTRTVDFGGGELSMTAGQAAMLATMSPKDRALAFIELTGRIPTLSEQNAILGSSVGGGGFDLSQMQTFGVPYSQQFAQNMQHFTDAGLDPTSAQWRAQMQTLASQMANEQARQMAEAQVQALNARGFDPSGSGGYQVGNNNSVLNMFGQAVDASGSPIIDEAAFQQRQANQAQSIQHAIAALKQNNLSALQQNLKGMNQNELRRLLDQMGIYDQKLRNVLTTQLAVMSTSPQQFQMFAKGGTFMAKEPIVGIGLATGRPRFLLGEAGKDEKLTIEPTDEDITLGRELGPEVPGFDEGGDFTVKGGPHAVIRLTDGKPVAVLGEGLDERGVPIPETISVTPHEMPVGGLSLQIPGVPGFATSLVWDERQGKWVSRDTGEVFQGKPTSGGSTANVPSPQQAAANQAQKEYQASIDRANEPDAYTKAQRARTQALQKRQDATEAVRRGQMGAERSALEAEEAARAGVINLQQSQLGEQSADLAARTAAYEALHDLIGSQSAERIAEFNARLGAQQDVGNIMETALRRQVRGIEDRRRAIAGLGPSQEVILPSGTNLANLPGGIEAAIESDAERLEREHAINEELRGLTLDGQRNLLDQELLRLSTREQQRGLTLAEAQYKRDLELLRLDVEAGRRRLDVEAASIAPLNIKGYDDDDDDDYPRFAEGGTFEVQPQVQTIPNPFEPVPMSSGVGMSAAPGMGAGMGPPAPIPAPVPDPTVLRSVVSAFLGKRTTGFTPAPLGSAAPPFPNPFNDTGAF